MQSATLRVLWVENMLDTELLNDILEDSGLGEFELVQAECLADALIHIETKTFDVVLLDLSLPDSRGLNTVKRMHENARDLPIIVLTGVDDESIGVRAVRAGAQDYISKTRMDTKMLARSVRYAIERSLTKEELRKTNEKLSSAIEELKSLDRMKDEFIALVSHELRTPLSSILGYAEALDECELQPERHDRFVRIIIEESKRLSRLIENVLDLSSLTAGSMKFEFAEMELDGIVDKAVQTLQVLAEDKDIEIEYASSGIGLVGDADRIEQVLINIIGNAIKFSPEGGRIGIDYRSVGETVAVSIGDEGPGIPPDSLDKVFERFRQLKREGTRIKGTGLGLSIAKYIVEAHGGEIRAENTGKGAVFRFTLPLSNGMSESADSDS
ncbi:MAG: response regulator [Proteobacteria bacterium]|nr:response regulator [Pseudomonadota bacterium]